MRATITSRAQMAENWGRVMVAPPPDSVSPSLPRALNLEHVMDLGNRIYFTFRGRAYGIPPLAWREGEKILDAWEEAKRYPDLSERADRRKYFDAIRRLQKLLWANTVPTGPFRRLLNFFGLHTNPFKRATEGEIAELAVFTLGRRMKHPGPASEDQASPSPGT